MITTGTNHIDRITLIDNQTRPTFNNVRLLHDLAAAEAAIRQEVAEAIRVVAAAATRAEEVAPMEEVRAIRREEVEIMADRVDTQIAGKNVVLLNTLGSKVNLLTCHLTCSLRSQPIVWRWRFRLLGRRQLVQRRLWWFGWWRIPSICRQ